MFPARMENHAAFVVELCIRPCEVSPEVEGVEAGGLAAGREFCHHLEGVVVKQRGRGRTCSVVCIIFILLITDIHI